MGTGHDRVARTFLDHLGLASALPWSEGDGVDGGPARSSTLASGGVPFEASVSAGPGRQPELGRYVIDVGSDQPSFEDRLTVQRQAMDRLVCLLPGPAQVVGREGFPAFVDLLFPKPGEVDAATRFATWLGVVASPEGPAPLAALKVYGNLRADDDSLARVSAEWVAFADLGAAAPSDLLEPMAAGLQVGPDGQLGHKLYLSPHSGAEHQAIEYLAERCGLDAGLLLAEVAGVGMARALWGPWVVVCLSGSAGSLQLTLYLAAAPFYDRDADVDGLVGQAARRHHGTTEPLDRVLAASAGTGVPWRFTWIGLGFDAASQVSKLSIYLAPLI